MNWITATRKPCPSARTAHPKPDVVFPLPFPVMTRRTPWRVARDSIVASDSRAAPSLAITCDTAIGYHRGGGVSNGAGFGVSACRPTAAPPEPTGIPTSTLLRLSDADRAGDVRPDCGSSHALVENTGGALHVLLGSCLER